MIDISTNIENVLYLISGSIFIIGLGFIIMSGGETSDPNIFSGEIYNFRRIRLAPLIVLSGFILCIFSILYKDKR